MGSNLKIRCYNIKQFREVWLNRSIQFQYVSLGRSLTCCLIRMRYRYGTLRRPLLHRLRGEVRLRRNASRGSGSRVHPHVRAGHHVDAHASGRARHRRPHLRQPPQGDHPNDARLRGQPRVTRRERHRLARLQLRRAGPRTHADPVRPPAGHRPHARRVRTAQPSSTSQASGLPPPWGRPVLSFTRYFFTNNSKLCKVATCV